MSYVEESLSKDEKIIGQFSQTKIEYYPAFVLLFPLFPLMYPMIWFSQWMTEYAVTNKRVITKTGFISRTTDEMNTNAVESVWIKQGILGRIFGYGQITISGRGNNTIVMKDVADVLNAKRTIESALSDNRENQ